jgi:hypothetical protein
MTLVSFYLLLILTIFIFTKHGGSVISIPAFNPNLQTDYTDQDFS